MRTHTLPLATGTPGFGVSRTERLVCVVEIQVHARVSIKKNATPISQPVWLGVGIEDPSGVVELQVYSSGTLEETLIYIFSHKHMHVHTRPFHHIVRSLSLQAGIPREIHQGHEGHTQPACGPMQWQWRVPTPNPGMHSDRGQIPRRRRRPKSATPLFAFEDPTHS